MEHFETNAARPQADAVVLFSGGLDSILAAKLLEEQGLRVRCLHFHSPFFGDPAAVGYWRRTYRLEIDAVDVSEDFCDLLRRRPEHNFGKVLNPCMDCKILLLRHARRHMERLGARIVATGEVLGQRPMSQRRDALNVIRRDAGVEDVLLRPLSALHLPPIPAEEEGFVDRSRLLGISGRGRKEQLALAERFRLARIPTPGGGCRLTEKENARRYWPVLCRLPHPTAADFHLANLGRQFWLERHDRYFWLSMGRNVRDNEALAAALGPEDARIGLAGLPGPMAVARFGASWPADVLADAAALTASYAGKALAAAQRGEPIRGRALAPDGRELWRGLVEPRRDGVWQEPLWEPAREEIRGEQRLRLQERERERLARREERRKTTSNAGEMSPIDGQSLQTPATDVLFPIQRH